MRTKTAPIHPKNASKLPLKKREKIIEKRHPMRPRVVEFL